MADRGRGSALQTIFSFFLGLMVTAFAGVGVYTFHPPPQEPLLRQIQILDREEVTVRDSRPPQQLTADDRDRIEELNVARNELRDAAREAQQGWGRSTSIILIIFATLVMAVSLVRADQLPVLGNGILLGGLFTMVYGIGWIIATDTSIVRFLVMTVAFAITLALGYVRFVRGRVAPPPAVQDRASGDAGMADLERRLDNLEARLNDAAGALGNPSR